MTDFEIPGAGVFTSGICDVEIFVLSGKIGFHPRVSQEKPVLEVVFLDGFQWNFHGFLETEVGAKFLKLLHLLLMFG